MTDLEKATESNNEHIVSASELNDLLSVALRAICLTRDYVGEEALPAVDGWEWYEAGTKRSGAERGGAGRSGAERSNLTVWLT